MTNSVIQWNCSGLRPNFDELSILIVKHNPLAVCLQETFLKDTDNITVRGFNLYHKCQETENRASGGVSILVKENVPQSIVTLNTNLQVTAHKTITLCSVYLPPRNHFNFNPKDLQSVIDQLPSPFILMGDFNGHHTLWGCKDVNNRGQQLEGLILKNELILLNDKSHTYFHSASGTFTSIDLTLCSPSLFLDFSWKVGPDPCGSDHFPILLENDGPPSLERVQRWKLAKANWDHFQQLCSTRLQQFQMLMFPCLCLLPFWRTLQKKLFLRLRQYQNVSINHGFSTFAKMQSKSATGPLKGSYMNQPRVTWMPITLLGLRHAEISYTVRKHLGEIMSPRWILKHRLNLFGIGFIKSKEKIQVILFTIYLSMTEMSRLIVTLLMYRQITFLIILPLLSAQMPLHLFARKLKSRL